MQDIDFPDVQIAVAQTIWILQGRFSYSGKSLAGDFLMKRANLHKDYKSQMLKDQVVMTSDQNIGEMIMSSNYFVIWYRFRIFQLEVLF